MDLNLKKSIENVNSNFPKRFGVFVNIDLSQLIIQNLNPLH